MKQEGKVNVWLFVFPPPLLHFPTAHLAGAAKERDACVKGRGLWVSLTQPQELLRMKGGEKTLWEGNGASTLSLRGRARNDGDAAPLPTNVFQLNGVWYMSKLAFFFSKFCSYVTEVFS